jgi:zinc protease
LYQLEIRPFDGGTTKPSTVDRSGLPEPGTPPTAEFPTFERAELANGLKVIVARRDAIPVVRFQLSLDAGYASDQFTKPGLASLAMNMLDEGTTNRDALEISEDLSMLGASVGAGSNLDTSFVSLSALTSTLSESVDLFADIVLNPSFPEKELPRLRKQQLTAIQREQSNPQQMALRVFPKLIYGEGHAYSNPFSGAGTLQSVQAITLEEIEQFHTTWFKPNHATMIVVGDTSLEEILPVIEARFSDWQPGEIPSKNVSRIEKPETTTLYLIDRPGSQQSILFAGLIATPKANPDEIATEAMNSIIGGAFTSRINMNLREDKHWSYGARSGLLNARGQRTFYILAGVQTDKTAESIQEVLKELRGYTSDQPTTEEELFKTVKSNTLSLSGRWETAASVLGDISQLVQYGLPDDYFREYPAAVNRLKSTDIDRIASKLIDPESLVWVVVGDRAIIEAGLQELGLGAIHLIDTEGNSLADAGASAGGD